MILTKRFIVPPNAKGFLYRNSRLAQTWEPGVYRVFSLFQHLTLITLPTVSRTLTVTNQEILTKDTIALRLSFNASYKITDFDRFLSKVSFEGGQPYMLALAEQHLHTLLQARLRELVMNITSEELTEKRESLLILADDAAKAKALLWGIELEEVLVRDITYPKNILELFSRLLEAKIRSKSDLENARTAVASARALKNAAELMKGDPDIRFFQYLETLTKIAAKGKHSFVIGNLPPEMAGAPQSPE